MIPRSRPNAIATQPHEGRIDILAADRHLVAVVAADAALEGVSLPTQRWCARCASGKRCALPCRSQRREPRAGRARHDARRRDCGACCCSSCCAASATRSVPLERRYRSRLQSLTIQSFEVVRAESIWRGVQTALSALRILFDRCDRLCALRIRLARVPLDARRRRAAWCRSRRRAAAYRWARRCCATSRSWLPGRARHRRPLPAEAPRPVLRTPSAPGVCPCAASMRNGRDPTFHIVRILMVLLALVIAYPYLPGSGSAAFQGLSIFAGLMLSLGASSAMASLHRGLHRHVSARLSRRRSHHRRRVHRRGHAKCA